MARKPETGVFDRIRRLLRAREAPAKPPKPSPFPGRIPDVIDGGGTNPSGDSHSSAPSNPPAESPSTDPPSSGPQTEGPAPIYASAVRARLDGAVDLSDGIIEFRLEETINRPVRCELRLGANVDVSVSHGTEIELFVGADGDRLFAGTVYVIGSSRGEGEAPQRRIVALDGLAKLDFASRTRSFLDAAFEDILTAVATDWGLSTVVSADGTERRQEVQANETDLEFLRRIGGEAGVEIWVEDSSIHAATFLERPGASLQFDVDQDFRFFDVSADLLGQSSSVVVSGWNDNSVDAISEEADSIQAWVAGDGRTALDILDVIGQSGTRGRQTMVHTGPGDEEVAGVTARFRLYDRARRFVTLKAGVEGSADLRIGARATVSGLASSLDGEYRIDASVHTFNPANGYRTSFEASRALVREDA